MSVVIVPRGSASKAVLNVLKRYMLTDDFDMALNELSRLIDVEKFVEFLEWLEKSLTIYRLHGFSLVRSVKGEVITIAVYLEDCGEGERSTTASRVKGYLNEHGLRNIAENMTLVYLKGFEKVEAELFKELESTVQKVLAVLREYANIVQGFEVIRDPDWGYTITITLSSSASEALKLNLRLQEMFKGIPVVVKWTGPKDISDEELADYLVKILNIGGFKAKASPGFSAVEAVREIRED